MYYKLEQKLLKKNFVTRWTNICTWQDTAYTVEYTRTADSRTGAVQCDAAATKCNVTGNQAKTIRVMSALLPGIYAHAKHARHNSPHMHLHTEQWALRRDSN